MAKIPVTSSFKVSIVADEPPSFTPTRDSGRPRDFTKTKTTTSMTTKKVLKLEAFAKYKCIFSIAKRR